MKNKNISNGLTVLVAATVAIFSVVIAGCEPSTGDGSQIKGAKWDNPNASQPDPGTASDPGSATQPDDYEPGGGVDQVQFSALKWMYGNFNGAGAVNSGVQISNLKAGKTSFTFKWDRNMGAWGKPASNHAELCAWFVKKNDGTWVGGKFDWVFNSNTSRAMHHFWPPGQSINYQNWGKLDWQNVPNPCQAAFVVVESNGKRRSNVITCTWAR